MFYKKKTLKKMWVTTHMLWFFIFIIWFPILWIYYYLVLKDATSLQNNLITNYMFVMTGLFGIFLLVSFVIFLSIKIDMFRNKRIYAAHKFVWKKFIKNQVNDYNKITLKISPRLRPRFQLLILWKSILYQVIFLIINLFVIITTTFSLQNVSSIIIFDFFIIMVWIILLLLNMYLIIYYWNTKFVHKK